MARRITFDWVTVQEIADDLGCTMQNVRKHMKRGRFPTARQINTIWLIHKTDLAKFKKLREMGAFTRRDTPKEEGE